MWFEVGVRYHKAQENGSEKAVTEKYAVDALCFTEAESAIIKKFSTCMSGEFQIKSVAQANYGEVWFSDKDEDDKWYKVKLSYINLDEKSGREKRASANYLVQAKSMQGALGNIDEAMRNSLVDYEVIGLTETKILDVFEPVVKQNKTEEE